jgi:hypothetical protein
VQTYQELTDELETLKEISEARTAFAEGKGIAHEDLAQSVPAETMNTVPTD